MYSILWSTYQKRGDQERQKKRGKKNPFQIFRSVDLISSATLYYLMILIFKIKLSIIPNHNFEVLQKYHRWKYQAFVLTIILPSWHLAIIVMTHTDAVIITVQTGKKHLISSPESQHLSGRQGWERDGEVPIRRGGRCLPGEQHNPSAALFVKRETSL